MARLHRGMGEQALDERSVGPGTVVGKYVLEERIGAGGFGEVFRARHQLIGSRVAIKVLRAKYARDAAVVARFVAEAQAVNRISHPGIVEISDFGEFGDRYYCVMELLEGHTLRHVLNERGHLPLAEALPILRDIASAVDAAHGAGIAHRDLKPDNVFLRTDGRVTLIDFGLAKLVGEVTHLTETGAVFGSPLYMSPEQCRGNMSDLRTDAYSFGALAYHVLTGRPPFEGEALEVALHHLNDEPELPSLRSSGLSERVDAVITALMAKDPARRPQLITAALDMITSDARLPRKRQSRRVWIGAVLVVASAVTIGWTFSHRAKPSWTITSLAMPKLQGHATQQVLGESGQMIFQDRVGFWQLDVKTGRLARILENAPDAAHVVAFGSGYVISHTDGTITIVGDRARSHVMTGRDAMPSPDGRWIGACDGSTLVAYDADTGKRRDLVDTKVVSACIVNWTPDSAGLVWNEVKAPRSGTMRVTSLDGASYSLDLASTHRERDFKWWPDGTVLYCAKGEHGMQLRRSHILKLGSFDVLRTFASDIDSCSIIAASSPDVAIVATAESSARAAMLDLNDGELRMFASATPTLPQMVTSDGKGLLAYEGTLYNSDRPVEISLATEERRLLHHCPDEVALFYRDGALVRFAFKRMPTVCKFALLRDADCREIATWSIPTTPTGMGFIDSSCGRQRCALTRSIDHVQQVWDLGVGEASRLVASLPTAGQTDPEMAMSRDDRWVVSSPTLGAIAITDLTNGRVTKFALGGGQVSALAWDEKSETVYVEGDGIDGKPRDSLLRVNRVGDKSKPLWTSHDVKFITMRTSEDGTQIAAGILDLRQQYYVVKPPRD